MPTKTKKSLGNIPAPHLAHIAEAQRYLENAQKLLTENGKKDGDYYQDKKYVRMAGNTIWNGVLEALDGTLNLKATLKKGQRADVKDYQMAIAKLDQKLGKNFVDAYTLIHLYMGYDGNRSYAVVKSGFDQAKKIVAWCEIHTPKPTTK